MSELEQLQIVGKVMADRSLPNRARVRVSRIRELGLPEDADVARLTAVWIEMRIREMYVRDNEGGTKRARK